MIEGEFHINMASGEVSIYYKGKWVPVGPLPELEEFFEKIEWSPVC